MNGGLKMDAIDYEILACLKENARENATNIGAKINLSTSAVIERMKKMESSGLIEQYTALINQEALGRNLTAFISVRLEHPKYYHEFVKRINENNSVAECYYIAGDFDFILKAVTKSGGALEEIINYVKYINGVSMTRTSVVLSTTKRDVCMLPEKTELDK
jgi:Lrp/AsnC family leucine-responsive transcriptional regulator